MSFDIAVRIGEHGCVIQRAEHHQHQADAEQEAEVAHAVDQERLQVGVDRRGARVPETDQQIGHQTHRFPTEEQLHEVVGHHQHQHGEGEQRDVAEETLITGIFFHVADGVDVHHERDESHHQHHHHGQAVDQEADLEAGLAGRHPFVDRAVEQVPRHHILEDRQRSEEGDRDQRDGDAMRPSASQHLAEQSGSEGTDQRCQGNQQIQTMHIHVHQPFKLPRSSTLMVRRLRNSTTRIAKPIAASAAATVRMKNTNTWPAVSFR